MEMKIPTLEADDIEVKIKQVTQKGAFALLYKTARTDMRILDEVYGVGNWQVNYQMVGDMLFCTISIWDEEKKQWIQKQSNGIESREDGEGNEVKGLASDCMKRAGFMLGIGRELYSSPRIFLNVATKQDGEFKGKPVYKLEDPWAKYVVTDIEYDTKRKVSKLIIANEKTGEIVYRYGVTPTNKQTPPPKKTTPKKEEKAEQDSKVAQAPKTEQYVKVEPTATVTTTTTLPNSKVQPWEQQCHEFLKKHKLDKQQFAEMRMKAVNDGKNITRKGWKDLTPDEWIELLTALEGLYAEGYFKDVA